MITKKQHEVLAKYRQTLKYAVHSNCVPAMSRTELDELEGIHVALGFGHITRRCGHCVLAMCKTLGTEFEQFEQFISLENGDTKEKKKRNVQNKRDKKRPSTSIREESTEGEGEVGSQESTDTE